MKPKIVTLTTIFVLSVCSFNAQVMVKDLDPAEKISSEPRDLMAVNGTLYFVSNGDLTDNNSKLARNLPADFHNGLWKSDGTESGTQFIDGFYDPKVMIGLNDRIFFVDQNRDQDTDYKSGLWINDPGSKRRPTFLKEIIPSLLGETQKTLRVINGELFFVLFDFLHQQTAELWKSNGTAKGTVSTGIKITSLDFAYLLNLTVVGRTLYFNAQDNTHGNELWRSDGTVGGTAMVKDINAVYTNTGDTQSSNLENLVSINGTLFFTADDGVHGRELWKSDGTDAGTVLVKEMLPGNLCCSFLGGPNITNVNGTAFFTADDSHGHGTQLWKSDGTAKGTVVVKDIGASSSFPSSLTNVNGTLFFTATDRIHGRELWKSNGSASGTVMVKDINTRSNNVPSWTVDSMVSPGEYLTDVNGVLYFVADDGIHGKELWRSDGTTAGTFILKDIKPFGAFGSDPKDLTNVNGVLYFTADDGPHGRELWKYDPSGK